MMHKKYQEKLKAHAQLFEDYKASLEELNEIVDELEEDWEEYEELADAIGMLTHHLKEHEKKHQHFMKKAQTQQEDE